MVQKAERWTLAQRSRKLFKIVLGVALLVRSRRLPSGVVKQPLAEGSPRASQDLNGIRCIMQRCSRIVFEEDEVVGGPLLVVGYIFPEFPVRMFPEPFVAETKVV